VHLLEASVIGWAQAFHWRSKLERMLSGGVNSATRSRRQLTKLRQMAARRVNNSSCSRLILLVNHSS